MKQHTGLWISLALVIATGIASYFITPQLPVHLGRLVKVTAEDVSLIHISHNDKRYELQSNARGQWLQSAPGKSARELSGEQWLALLDLETQWQPDATLPTPQVIVDFKPDTENSEHRHLALSLADNTLSVVVAGELYTLSLEGRSLDLPELLQN